jgi:hypothetical protein
MLDEILARARELTARPHSDPFTHSDPGRDNS